MIYRDVSSIPTNGCSIITSSTVITNYQGTNSTIRTYELLGNTYILRSQTTGSTPTNALCQNQNVLTHLQSNFDYIEPFYHLFSIASILIIVYLAFKLILRPFISRGTI
jgi:hypothetical protein